MLMVLRANEIHLGTLKSGYSQGLKILHQQAAHQYGCADAGEQCLQFGQLRHS